MSLRRQYFDLLQHMAGLCDYEPAELPICTTDGRIVAV
jgi:hypothetical protein